jgi:hypothetical protein
MVRRHGLLSGLLLGSVLLAACDNRGPAGPSRHAHAAKTGSVSVRAASTLRATLSARERRLALGVVRMTATTTHPRPRRAFVRRPWSSNVTRVLVAVSDLADAAAWKQPGTAWQLSDRREANHPVLVVQMFGRFRFFQIVTPPGGAGWPIVQRVDVPELTYVISALDGARLSAVRGAAPDLRPAATLFAR